MEEQEVTEVQVTDLSRGGSGVSRDPSGRVVFVPLSAPGDRLRVRILETKKRYAEAEILEVLESSKQRIVPRCKFFGNCGGCTWQHLPYEMQWATKSQGVRAVLERVGLTGLPRVEEFPAQDPWGYRNRIQLRGSGRELGYYARGSHRLVPIDRCEIAREPLNAQLPATVEDGSKRPGLYKVELELLSDGSVRSHWNLPHGAGGFRQVNDVQNRQLQDWIAGALEPGRELLDLFGGSGNLSLGLATRMSRVDCVDVGSPRTAPDGMPPNFVFHRRSVLAWLLAASRDPAPAARSAILDPPREGLGENGPAMILALERLGVREAVAVGCDPDSWARDLSRFLKKNWRISRLAAFDFFPQTPHVEAVALLRKSE